MNDKDTSKQIEIVKNVVTKPVPCIVYNDDMLRMLLHNIGCSVFAEVVTVTEPSMRKTGNTFLARGVEKVGKANVNFGGIYKNAVEKIMGKEDIEGNFEPAPLQWGQHWEDSKTIIEHKGKYYAQMRPLRSDSVSYRWADTKEALTESEVVELKTFFPAKREGSRQPGQKKVIIRTVKLENIREIRMQGIRYQRG